MKRFAANRICLVTSKQIFRNQVIEVDEESHQVVSRFDLTEEVRQTEWKGGIILVSPISFERENNEGFKTCLERISAEVGLTDYSRLYAFHVTSFNVSLMEFSPNSRIVLL